MRNFVSMDLFNVYPRFSVAPVRAEGVYVYDAENQAYLDLYGGHGVISVGHNHPEYLERLTEQIRKISFYSNAVEIPLQNKLAKRLGSVSRYEDYQLFLCSSGAEANENALKVASFATGRKKVVAFENGFHGRTAAALNVTDNPNLSAPLNRDNFPVVRLPLNDEAALETALQGKDVAAVIVEGIQGVGGLDRPSEVFLQFARRCTRQYGTKLVLDEIQSGFGRSGRFFAHQHAGIQADVISMAKGMGNGFPVGGVLIHPDIKAEYGMLGTTFGGNHAACAATLAVLDILEKEKLIAHADTLGTQLQEEFAHLPGVQRVKGRGLMLGLDMGTPIKALRQRLLEEHRIFTGSSANPNVIRILPPLPIQYAEIKTFIEAFKKTI